MDVTLQMSRRRGLGRSSLGVRWSNYMIAWLSTPRLTTLGGGGKMRHTEARSWQRITLHRIQTCATGERVGVTQ